MTSSYRRLWNTFVSGIDKTLGRSRVAARPLRIHIEVNDFCNLKCPYCPRENPHIPKNTGNIPVETVRKLEPWMRYANYVGLAGNGEPFLHPQILEILRIVTGAGAVPSVITNGTRFRPAMIEELPTLGPMLLQISVDGGTKETFEKWRRGADFDQVRSSLIALKESRERHRSPYPVINFIVCLMKENVDETELIVDLAAETGTSVIVFQTMFPYVKELEYLRVKDLKVIDEAVEKARRRAAGRGIRIDYVPMSFDLDYREGVSTDPTVGSIRRLEEQYLETLSREPATDDAADSPKVCPSSPAPPEPIAAPNGRRAVYHCENIWHQMHVTLQGDVKHCCFWTEGIVGNINHDRLEDLWNGPAWDAVRGAIHSGHKPPPCQGCHWLVRRDRKKIWRDTVKELRDLWRDRR